jgi:hypothetical protein
MSTLLACGFGGFGGGPDQGDTPVTYGMEPFVFAAGDYT